jgi:hypothetical protein
MERAKCRIEQVQQEGERLRNLLASVKDDDSPHLTTLILQNTCQVDDITS